MDCVEEAEDPREKSRQAGVRPCTSVEIISERAGRVVERRCSAHATCVRQPVLPESGVIQLACAGLAHLLSSETDGCRTARPSLHLGCAVQKGEPARALSTRCNHMVR